MKKQIAFKYKADVLRAREKRLQLIQEDSDGNLTLMKNTNTDTNNQSKKKRPREVNLALNEKINQILMKASQVSSTETTASSIVKKRAKQQQASHQESPVLRYKDRAPFTPFRKPYKCCWCTQFFSTLAEVRVENHGCLPLFNCTDCDPHTTFKSRKALTIHLRMNHATGRHECSECNFVAATKTYLDKHVSRIHTDLAAPAPPLPPPQPSTAAAGQSAPLSASSSSADVPPINREFVGEREVLVGGIFVGNSDDDDVVNVTADQLALSTSSDSDSIVDHSEDTAERDSEVNMTADTIVGGTEAARSNGGGGCFELSEFSLTAMSHSATSTNEEEIQGDSESLNSSPQKKPLRSSPKGRKLLTTSSTSPPQVGGGVVPRKKTVVVEAVAATPQSSATDGGSLLQPKRAHQKNDQLNSIVKRLRRQQEEAAASATSSSAAAGQKQPPLSSSVAADASGEKSSSPPSIIKEQQKVIGYAGKRLANNGGFPSSPRKVATAAAPVNVTYSSHKERMADLLAGIKMEDTSIRLDKDRCSQCLRTQYAESSMEKHLRRCRGTYHLKGKVKCPFCREPKRYFGNDVMLTHHINMKHNHEQALSKWRKFRRDKMRREMEAVISKEQQQQQEGGGGDGGDGGSSSVEQ